MSQRSVVVVGGGIAGLSAAWQLTRQPDAPRVTVLESSAILGGKIQTTPFAGLPVDTGPDAFLAAAPAALNLCEDLGIADELVAPDSATAWIYSKGRLQQFPIGTVLGVPSNVFSLMHLVSARGMLRAALDVVLPRRVGRLGSDVSVGHLIRSRFGSEVAERLIDPLVGGINAGNIDELSLRSAAPQLQSLSDAHRSLFWAAHRKAPKPSSSPKKRVFLATPGGMHTLIDKLVARLDSVDLRTSSPVSSLSFENGAWSIDVNDEVISADAVVLATPSAVAAELLRGFNARAATLLGSVRCASVAMVRLAYGTEDVKHPLDGSGFVVPAVDNTLMTACSWASSKWRRLHSPGKVIFRVSAGRLRDPRCEELSDDVLVKALHDELRVPLGITGEPIEADVTRWTKAFPQYEPGHALRVAEARSLLSDAPLSLAGASYDGVGIPACIESGVKAATEVLA